METEERSFYRKCTTCREPVAFGARHYVCSVSTCNRKRLTLVFCSVPCWEAHQADARHRDAWAEEAHAPSLQEWQRERAELAQKERTRAGRYEVKSPRGAKGRQAHDVLVVVTKFKQYIRERANMNTSDRVFGLLSDHLRDIADRASERAARDGRRTLLERDVEPLFERERRSLATGESAPDSDRGEVLVVVSKFKKYVKTSTGMNTSDGVIPALSEHLRHLCRQAIKSAGRSDRRTVMPQDFSLREGD